MRKAASGGLVYSTEGGRMCPACRQPVAACACRDRAAAAVQGDGIIRVQRETKGRGGKAVTVARGFDLDPEQLAALGKRLRTACGAGGTVKDRAVEVQGDHGARMVEFLKAEGWTVKPAG